ncbi:ABC transporter permease [Actinoplanes hulinensis]|uniref:ABC transporter permease n=1 Tax=Actinoplanes hulinensis TaxID=1144547 RepID=A0ABS7BEJ5_9ACTN|nr:FtsX-like permease family protein [Actinoplanes hulinensis]MBW6439301.1 ABC transporter permease [Actinoplanes hulinensis]
MTVLTGRLSVLRVGLHWPSVRGRARADTGPLILSALVVALVSLLAGAVPGLMRDTADAAVRDAVRQAGPSADVTVQARWEPDDFTSDGSPGRMRMSHLAADLADLRGRSLEQLSPDLRAALRPPVASVITPTLRFTDGSVLRTFRMAYLDGGDSPAVEWIDGSAPSATVDGQADVPYNGPPWRVRVGLSESAAASSGVRPGALLQVRDERGATKNVQVSGIFRPVDRNDPAWRLAPWLLDPAADADGAGTTRFGGLLTAESLPDARLAFKPDELRRIVTFSPDPSVLTWETAHGIAATAITLKATSATSSSFDTAPTWNTQLDSVLRDVTEQVSAARVQASVLLFAVIAGAVLVLALAASLLGRRRSAALALARQRGATLPVLGTELLLESGLVTLVAAAVGCAAAYLVTGSVAGWWVAPVVLAAAGAGPAYGIIAAASATRDRKVPANRSARRWLRHTAALRRAATEVAVLLAATAAVVSLFQRGPAPGLPALAPTLAAVAASLLLLRLLPLVTGLVLRRLLRSRRPLAVFGAAQAAESSGRALPVLTLVTSAVLAVFALTLGATVRQGLIDGARETVGADARIDITDDASGTTASVAERIAAQPGVTSVTTAQVIDGARIIAGEALVPSRLVIRSGGVPDPSVPALVRSASGQLRPGMSLELRRDDEPPVRLTASGVAPVVSGADEVVIVDAAALTAAGVESVPNTIWVNGPGTESAVTGAGALLRSEVLRDRQGAPLVNGLLWLSWASAVLLVLLGLAGFALAAAAGAPQRWQTLSRLRTLGLTPRDARRVAAGELLPWALTAAVGGVLAGAALTALFSALELRLLTGQEVDPAVMWPWLGLAVVAALFVAAVPVIVRFEAVARRRRQLAEVLRVGGQ